MDLKALKQLRAELGYLASDPDNSPTQPDCTWTNVQKFHFARAMRLVRDAVVEAEAADETRRRVIPSLHRETGPLAARS